MKKIKDTLILFLLTAFCASVTMLQIKYINAVCVLNILMWMLMIFNILFCVFRHKGKWVGIQIGRIIFFYKTPQAKCTLQLVDKGGTQENER